MSSPEIKKGTSLAEATQVPRTFFRLRFRIDVQVHAFRIAALAVIRKKPAFGHFLQIVLVQELAGVALLA